MTPQITTWLQEGLALLGHPRLNYDVAMDAADPRLAGSVAITCCMAPAPDGEPYYCLILFHPDRLASLSEADQRETVLHELAHVVDFAADQSPTEDIHGAGWRAAMERMGVEATVAPVVPMVAA